MNDLKDRVIMITGASSGFGREAAKMCVDLGAKVVLGARREEKLKELCDELGADSASYKVTDVTSKEQMHGLANHGIEKFGKIDSLVNNAGIMPLSLLAKGRTDEWDHMIDVNIKGVLYGIDSVYSHMIERESGQIINISSVRSLNGAVGASAYSSSKSALIGLNRSIAKENARFGVTSNILNLGYFDSGLFRKFTPERKVKYLSEVPSKKLGSSNDIYNAIHFLISSDYTNGSVITIDGCME